MLPMKIDLTEEIANALRQLRLNNPVNGSVLTAEKLSKAIGNNRAWMSQIESRRLKKIRREDIISIYKLLFNLDDEQAEYKAEHDLVQYYNPDSIINFIDKFMNDILNIDDDDDDAIEESYNSIKNTHEILTLSLDRLNDLLVEKYHDLKNASERMEFFDFMDKLNSNIFFNFSDTMKIFSSFNMELLKYASKNERKNIINSISNISQELEKFKPRQILDIFKKRLELIDSECQNSIIMDPQQTKNLLQYGLVELTQLFEYEKSIPKCIAYTNSFIAVTKKFYQKVYPKVSWTVNTLPPTSSKETLLSTIDSLQLILYSDKGIYNIQGKLSSQVTHNKSPQD